MKKLLFINILFALALYSCDPIESPSENLQKSIKEFNKKQTNIDIASFVPKTYTEIKTDSLISNTFKVHIKNYSKMGSNILMNTERQNKNTILNYHRIFESEIRITTGSTIVLNTTFQAEDFRRDSQSDFWNNATLEHVWINQERSNSNELYLDISIINPKNKTFKQYQLVVDTKGKQDLYLIQEHS